MSCLMRAPAEPTDSRLGMCLALPLGVPEENLRIALRKSWTERSFQPCWWQTWISLKRPFRGQDEGKQEETRHCPKGWRARSDVQRWSKIRFVSKVFLCVFIWTPPCCLASHDVANRRYILFCLTVVLKTSTLFPLLIQQIFARCSCCLGMIRCSFYIGKSLWSQHLILFAHDPRLFRMCESARDLCCPSGLTA